MKVKLMLILCLCISISLILSCSKKEDSIGAVPIVIEFGGHIDSVGKTIYIYGKNFSDEASKNIVIFNNAEQAAISVTPDTSGKNRILKVIIPPQAKTGVLSVKIGKLTSNKTTDTLFILKRRKWEAMATFIGSGRINACSFSIGNNGYIMGGITKYNGGTVLKDFYQYNATTNTWTKKADFPGAIRRSSFAFVLNGKAYIGGGFVANNGFDYDVYEYNPTVDQWTKKANLPRSVYASGYATMGNYGYVIDDDSQTMLQYDIANDKWTIKNNLDWYYGTSPRGSTAFTINNKLYHGFGYQNSNSSAIYGLRTYNEVGNNWNYNAATEVEITNRITAPRAINNVTVYNNTFYAAFGDIGKLYSYNWQSKKMEPFIDSQLNIIEHAASFLIGSRMYVTGGHSDFYAQGTTKTWMIDLSPYIR